MSDQATAILERFPAEVEAELRALLSDRQSAVFDMLRYHLGWVDEQGHPSQGFRGKMLRPTLCLLACEAADGDYRQALPLAAALELVHNFSLIHDDIEDRSPLRHHRLTLWQLWGEAQAINAGDAMYAMAQLTVLRLADRGVPTQDVLIMARELDEACVRLCEGQHADLQGDKSLTPTVASYLDMVAGKSAALIEMSTYLGARLGGCEPEAAQHLRRAGREMGFAFQVRDDVLGIWGDEAATGKSSASDLLQRKKSLPVVYALEQAAVAEKDALRRVFARDPLTESDVAEAVSILERAGARRFAEQRAAHYCQRALDELTASRLTTPALNDLRTVAYFLAHRQY